jgi:Protein of unknown function (DUF2934)
MGISEDAIRERAYHIWEREGRPHGRDFEHWVRAQIELIAETTSTTTASPPSGNSSVSRPRPSSARNAAPPKPSRAVSARNSRTKKPA